MHCAAGLLLIGAQLIGCSAGAQSPTRGAGTARVECTREGPSHDFRRVTSDSEEVRVLSGAPSDLAQRVASASAARHIPRDRLDYDFVLDIPRLCIEYLELHVDSLRARVSLDANVADMVHVAAGAGVFIDHVDLTLTGVRATALLAVDLSRLVQVVDATMAYLEANPAVLSRVLGDSLRARRR